MQNVQVVTDSCARFANAQFVNQYGVTVVPNKITIGSKTYREEVDISAEEALQQIAGLSTPPTVTPPTTEEWVEAYKRLAKNNRAIISIHSSREIYKSWQNARLAAQQLAGYCEIAVIDSQTLCAAQGMLVRAAVKAIQQEETVEAIISTVRGAVDRLYSVYYIEKLDYLLKNGIMSESHAVLGSMLGIKPFLTIEEGRLVPTEKVKTRSQAVDQLVEFLVEFTDVEDMAIVQPRPHVGEQTRLLQDRLALEFPGRYFPHTVYSASLGALIGADATGLVILEEKMEAIDDDF